MIKQNIFIINFNLLYEILDEIKENLYFKIIKYESEHDFIKNNDLEEKNTIIILKSGQKLVLSKNLNEKNLLTLNDIPISLIKLVELINIQSIKLRFNQQSKINIKDYELNLNSKFFLKDDLALKLTEKEIEIILYLEKHKTKKTVQELQKDIWGYPPNMETHTVETHIYRLRKKISDKFSDEKLILSNQNGYFIS